MKPRGYMEKSNAAFQAPVSGEHVGPIKTQNKKGDAKNFNNSIK